MAAPRSSPVERYLRSLHARFQDLSEGTVATYIPELGKADPRWFGICVATLDGHVYEIGETRRPFTVQSISKPFVYGLALEDRGKEAVLERIGVEPTGDAFNEVSLEAGSGRPRNPMINAGAITATSLVAGRSAEDRWSRMLALFSLYSGRRVELNEAVYRSECETGHRNRAIGHMLRNFGILTEDPGPALDLYFRQCSIDVTCRDLSLMAATLAAGGVNPVTGERALEARNVDEVLSVMTTCGMYDYAGEWVYRVGFPAKSGVSGGILAVLPGQLGIGVFSPPLDARGNSVRGVAVCRALSEELELHFLRAPRAALSALRARYTLRDTRSKRVRSERELELLAALGHHAILYELQGDLSFTGMELVARKLAAERSDTNIVALDLAHARELDGPAASLLRELVEDAGAEGRQLALAGLARHPRLRRALEEARLRSAAFPFVQLDDRDAALEWCEERLLEAHSPSAGNEELPLERHGFLEGLEREEIEIVASSLERRELAPRQLVVRKGEPADELFLVVRGELSVLAEEIDGGLRRLSTLSAGMGFGEPALLSRATRTAYVRADRPSVCWVLARPTWLALRDAHPQLALKLLENLLRSSARIVERLSGDEDKPS